MLSLVIIFKVVRIDSITNSPERSMAVSDTKIRVEIAGRRFSLSWDELSKIMAKASVKAPVIILA